MHKRILILFMMVALIVIPVLSGCSNNANDTNNTANTNTNTGANVESKTNSNASTGDAANADNSPVTPPGEFPITKEKVTLKVMIPSQPGVTWETNAFTKWYEEKTNVHLEFDEVAADGAAEALNLRLASGDIPDMIIGFAVSPAQQQIYGDQGVFLDLKPFIEKYGHYIKDLYEYDPTAEATITTPNKKIYSMPNTSDCFHCQFAQKMWIYKPWLDELNLPIPTTTDEFYTTLKAFKEHYPGSVPLVTMPNSWNTDIDAFLMNSFIFNDYMVNKRMWLNNGKVDVSFNKPEFREGLEYLNKLYSEGLLAPESFTNDAASLTAMVMKEKHIVGASAGGYAGLFADLASDKWYNFVAVPPLKGPNGVQIAAWNPFITTTGGLLINANTKYPEVAYRWADGLYQEEVFERQKYGQPETYYTFNVGDLKGINGDQAVWKELKP
ncbi:extracellular solute-binding protein [Paenibacillus montanisoli]|nr:extracellular solute-binding protein [Paenibacillus montanisoli]